MIFTINEQMVRAGAECDTQHCPGALSMEEMGVWAPTVHYSRVSGGIEGIYCQAETPEALKAFMNRFDNEIERDELLSKPEGSIEPVPWEVPDGEFLHLEQCVRGCFVYFTVSVEEIRAARLGDGELTCTHCRAAVPVLPWDEKEIA